MITGLLELQAGKTCRVVTLKSQAHLRHTCTQCMRVSERGRERERRTHTHIFKPGGESEQGGEVCRLRQSAEPGALRLSMDVTASNVSTTTPACRNASCGNGTGVYSTAARPPSGVFVTALYGAICLMGVTGNLLVLFTLLRKRARRFRALCTAPDVFICSLSLVDALFLLGMPFLLHQLVGDGEWKFGAALCTTIAATDAACQFASTYILTLMTLDRYLATVYAVRSAPMRTPRLALCVVLCAWALSLLTVTPVWLFARLLHTADGRTRCAMLLPNPGTDIYWYTLYQFVLAFAAPVLVICATYARILRHMSTLDASPPLVAFSSNSGGGGGGGGASGRWGSNVLEHRTRRITRMALAVCVSFVACWAPFYALQLIGLSQPRAPPHLVVYDVAIGLGYLNSCVNPFLYVALSDTFKKSLLGAMVARPKKEGALGGGVSRAVELRSLGLGCRVGPVVNAEMRVQAARKLCFLETTTGNCAGADGGGGSGRDGGGDGGSGDDDGGGGATLLK
uniref:Melanin-concentrating hormone receptor 1 n=1 Tax=Petromyzon marinus TaxID=7757 RepID=A0AAJ7X0N4_PETMA|nr:melanin-concentrating hormone receptor 1-like [Petromyzon marinus]